MANGGLGPDLAAMSQTTTAGFEGYGLLAAAIVFTYDSWFAGSYFGGEVKSGGLGVAVGSLQGVVTVVVPYR